jgi:hypothetical protein
MVSFYWHLAQAPTGCGWFIDWICSKVRSLAEMVRMSTSLSALIPVTPGVPVAFYVAQSELPREGGMPRFVLDGITLLIHWPGRAEPFGLLLGPAELADVVANRALWVEVDDAGEAQRTLAIQLERGRSPLA